MAVGGWEYRGWRLSSPGVIILIMRRRRLFRLWCYHRRGIFKLLFIHIQLPGKPVYGTFMLNDHLIELFDNHFQIHQLEFNLL